MTVRVISLRHGIVVLETIYRKHFDSQMTVYIPTITCLGDQHTTIQAIYGLANLITQTSKDGPCRPVSHAETPSLYEISPTTFEPYYQGNDAQIPIVLARLSKTRNRIDLTAVVCTPSPIDYWMSHQIHKYPKLVNADKSSYKLRYA